MMSSLFSAIGSSVDQVVGQGHNLIMSNRQKVLANRAAEDAYNRNIEQWNRENDYNLPQNQIQRFKDAGLSPHLIYGQQNTAASSPTRSVANIAPPISSMPRVMSSFMDFRRAISDINKTDKEIDLIGSNISTNAARTALYDAQKGLFNYNLEFKKKIEKDAINTISENLEKSRNYNRLAPIIREKSRFDRDIRRKELHDYEEFGLRPNDPWYLRSLMNIFGGFLKQPLNYFKKNIF